jgi:hypothetical protein
MLRQEGRTSEEGDRRIFKYEPSNKVIFYGMTTYSGQSGCPVIYDGKMIALHAQSGK